MLRLSFRLRSLLIKTITMVRVRKMKMTTMLLNSKISWVSSQIPGQEAKASRMLTSSKNHYLQRCNMTQCTRSKKVITSMKLMRWSQVKTLSQATPAMILNLAKRPAQKVKKGTSESFLVTISIQRFSSCSMSTRVVPSPRKTSFKLAARWVGTNSKVSSDRYV